MPLIDRKNRQGTRQLNALRRELTNLREASDEVVKCQRQLDAWKPDGFKSDETNAYRQRYLAQSLANAHRRKEVHRKTAQALCNKLGLCSGLGLWHLVFDEQHRWRVLRDVYVNGGVSHQEEVNVYAD